MLREGERRGPGKVCGTGGWILHYQTGFFVALGFVRFVGESRSSWWVELAVSHRRAHGTNDVEISRRYPTPLRFGDIVPYPLSGAFDGMILRAVGWHLVQ
jgi:hypothetical protein